MARYVVAIIALSMFLSACQAPRSSSRVHVVVQAPDDASGKALANELNERYYAPHDGSREKCSEDQPLYACAGILYRAVGWDKAFYFWNSRAPSPDYDGVSFSYLQKYTGDRDTYRPQGFVISLPKDWKPWGPGPNDHLEMFCSFPYDGMTGRDRGTTGCEQYRADRESRPCDAVDRADDPIKSAGAYAVHYLKYPRSIDQFERWQHNCSFGTAWKPFFDSVLYRASGTLEPTSARYSEQVLRNWPMDRPDAMPIQAIYYDTSAQDKAKALNDARGLVQDFLEATGRTLPILRWERDPKLPPFGYEAADQGPPTQPARIRPRGTVPAGAGPATYHGPVVPDGFHPSQAPSGRVTEADKLNERFATYPVRCADGTPGYFCSGVLFRAIAWSSDAYFWNNRLSDDYDGVSFSYWRKDVGDRVPYRPVGYILAPASVWGTAGTFALKVYCSFAFDGWTGANRGLHGCGADTEFPEASRPCAEQGITSVQAFAKHYLALGENGSEIYRWRHSCSFGDPSTTMSPEVFLLSVLARQGGTLEPMSGGRYTEQVISTWPHNQPERLPVEAFFVLADFPEPVFELIRNEARGLRADYFEATGRLLPIVRMTRNTSLPLFTYCDVDQAPPDAAHSRLKGVIPHGVSLVGFHDAEVTAIAGKSGTPMPLACSDAR